MCIRLVEQFARIFETAQIVSYDVPVAMKSS